MVERRHFLGMLGAAAARGAVPQLRLIAHRGGVVDEDHPENSPGSIQAAIQRGYWMIEVDIRATKDGEPILQHDPTFKRYYGVDRRPEDMTWAELTALRSTPGNTSPIHFQQVCDMCKGRIRLMLDIKNQGMLPTFYRGLARRMEGAGILRGAYMLGSQRMRVYFWEGGALGSANRTSLRGAAERGEDVANRYFLFELGSILDSEAYSLCRKLKVEPVAAINTFRYTMQKRDEWKGPADDISRLRKLGVESYQIDSIYEPLFRY
jgi:glycerophosphoryl diester phosphodiesterase